MEGREKVIAMLKQKMGNLLQERESVVNRGKTVEKVSARQQRRKLSHFCNVSEAALWFADSFGLVVDQLTTHTVDSKSSLLLILAQLLIHRFHINLEQLQVVL